MPGRYVLAIGAHAASWALFRVTGSPVPTPASTAPVEVHVASCPVPAGDYAGTPYSPRPAPGMLNLPASLTLPGNAQIFGTEFLPGSTSYMLGPKSATCQGYLASVDGGGLTRITNAGSAADVPIDYSSDGRQIVFGLCRVKTHSPSLSWYFALVRLPCGIR